ncbi:hypothetical protein KKA14_11985 [bacterium]|nr:hypothetical protein [bacterium]
MSGYLSTPVGKIPTVSPTPQTSDHFGSFKVRLGIGRNSYAISPGLYAVGTPDENSPVLVSANYKLSFDHLRGKLEGIDAWILVLETRGVNVWCAAGKGTFSTAELVERVKQVELEKVVRHRKLVLPQLSATGVAAHVVKKSCGFRVYFGPVLAKDIPQYLENGMKASKKMRSVTFSIKERAVLIPIEIKILLKPATIIFVVALLLSGFSPDIFSINSVFSRGWMPLVAGITGILSGAVIAPILLPWVPGTLFALKGAITGLLTGLGLFIGFGAAIPLMETLALLLFSIAISSYLTMNFTGSTPFTSPSGVEKEMRLSIPVQVSFVVIATVLWMVSPFMN